MKIVHVVPHISNEASGPSYSVPRLAEATARVGHDVEISCLGYGINDHPDITLDFHPQWRIFSSFAISHRHALALRRKATVVDIVHNHSLWSMANVSTGWVVPGKHAKLVTSARGTLSEWALAHGRSKKRILWPLQKRVLERADLLHATSEQEFTEMRRLGLKAPIVVLPNGIDVPEIEPSSNDFSPRILLFVSRIHPKKGLEDLLDAWSQLEDHFSDWKLRIVGPGEVSYLEELKKRMVRNNSKRVEFVGPLYGEEKSGAYRSADLFVLPTHSENFGMVVAEALAHGCPAIVSREAPWPGLNSEDCGWWIPGGAQSFEDTLRKAMWLSPLQLRAMGARGRAWMRRDFSWSMVGERMTEAYLWLEEGGVPPEFVRLS